jgi:hypothetical protein
MMFKEKSSKKKLNIDNNDTFTLDAMHNNMIKNFENIDKELQNQKELLELYESDSNYILNIIENELADKETLNILWTSNINLREKIIDAKNKINELNNFDEVEYYKNTSYILFQYYDTVDKQSEINNFSNNNIIKSSVDLPTLKQSRDLKSESKKKKNANVKATINVLDALNNIDNNVIEKEHNETKEYKEVSGDKLLSHDKSALVDKYMSIIDKKYVRNVEDDNIEICKKCNNQMLCLQQDAIMICNLCGYQELLLVEQNRPILKQNTKDTSHFCYKRINHFREWCNQVQGKESTDIPDEIFEKILTEIKKEKIVDLKTITYSKMRDILKRLRINKYYEHINYIINRINGIPTPQFSPELEEKLCNMFRSIQAPFLKHCPKDRKNFLSYSYVLYKFFQILGLNEYLKYFPLLKSREKLYVQDQIWKKICIDLNYEIIPSL